MQEEIVTCECCGILRPRLKKLSPGAACPGCSAILHAPLLSTSALFESIALAKNWRELNPVLHPFQTVSR